MKNISNDKYDIKFDMEIKDDPKNLARINFTIENLITVKGFRLTKSKFEGLWLQPPKIKSGNQYYPIVFIEDKEFWTKIEEEIKKEYTEQKDKEKEEYVDLDNPDSLTF